MTDYLILMTDDNYNELVKNVDLFVRTDTSNLPDGLLMLHQCEKENTRHFSDEMNGNIITEFFTLQTKSYAHNID